MFHSCDSQKLATFAGNLCYLSVRAQACYVLRTGQNARHLGCLSSIAARVNTTFPVKDSEALVYRPLTDPATVIKIFTRLRCCSRALGLVCLL